MDAGIPNMQQQIYVATTANDANVSTTTTSINDTKFYAAN